MAKTVGLSFAFLFLILFTGTASAQDDKKDGRFTIGTKTHSLLFGYPYKYSCSHFLLGVDGRYASASDIYRNEVRHLKAEQLEMHESPGSQHSVMVFNFDNVNVIQHLIPLDKDFKEVDKGRYGQYYKLEYEIVNTKGMQREINFMQLLDVKVGKDDGVSATSGGTALRLDKPLKEGSIPKKVTFKNKAAKTGVLLPVADGSTPADAFCFGQWSYLTNVMDITQHESVSKFTDDNAFVIFHKGKKLNVGDTLRIASIIGFSGEGSGNLQMQHHAPKKMEADTIFFEPGQSELSEDALAKIEKLVRGKWIRGAMIEGYTDASGDEKRNLALSKSRIKYVSEKLQMYGVKYDYILSKSHGEFFAATHADTSESSKRNERKVIVRIWH